jgi:thioredoxin reductase/CRP-like cAMP-binding protein/Fe-S-cluster-containing dehydrogenase component
VSDRFDVVIIGSGPAGLAAGAQAAARKISHVVLERGELANTIYRYQKGKHVMDEPPRLQLHGELPLRFEAGSREEVLEAWKQGAEAAGVNLRRGPGYEVRSVTGGLDAFALTLANGESLSCKRIVLAIGLQGNLRRFQVPGAELPHVTYQLDDPGEHTGKRIVVIGVGDAGLENALALVETENEVALVNRQGEIDRAKARNRALTEAAIKAGKITYHTFAEVERFEPGVVVLQTQGGSVSLGADLVIGRLGADPPRRFLESLGVTFPSKDPAAVPKVSERYETNVPGLHVIGALAGYPLIKNCMNQGFEVIEQILGRKVVPADEPILREKFAGLPGSVSEIIERIRSTIPIFNPLTPVQLREFLVDSSVHSVKRGATIFERNDFTDSFYTILDGEVEIALPARDADADSDLRRTEKRALRHFRLARGDFFGEGSLISGRRRTGTVKAASDSIVIETPRLSMNKLIRSVADVKRVIDTTFLLRRLEKEFSGVPVEALRALAQQATVQTFKRGETLFSEGDAPDGLHFLRLGSATISKRRAGRDQVIAYVQAANYVGEAALLSPDGRRNATVRAAVQTETVRLPTEAVRPFLVAHPEIVARFEREQLKDLAEQIGALADTRATDLVSFLERAGVGEATDLLLIDEALCVRCNNSETACAETHNGVSRLDREAGPTFGTIHVPTSCRHCENPKCMTDCPPDALRRKPSGEVYILDNCIGCGNCAANCPYEVIQMAAVDKERRPGVLSRLLFGPKPKLKHDPHAAKKAVKCDLCTNLPARSGGGTKAACVSSCPTGAIVRVNPRDYIHEVLTRER